MKSDAVPFEVMTLVDVSDFCNDKEPFFIAERIIDEHVELICLLNGKYGIGNTSFRIDLRLAPLSMLKETHRPAPEAVPEWKLPNVYSLYHDLKIGAFSYSVVSVDMKTSMMLEEHSYMNVSLVRFTKGGDFRNGGAAT